MSFLNIFDHTGIGEFLKPRDRIYETASSADKEGLIGNYKPLETQGMKIEKTPMKLTRSNS
jgi:hypothetical protein